MIIRGTWMPIMTLCIPDIKTDWTLRRLSFPLSAILDCSEIRSMTSYVWFNLVLNKSLFTRSRDIHPRDLVTRCNFMDGISPSGPRVSIHYMDLQIPLL